LVTGTDESRSFLEPHYFGKPVLKLGVSIAFPPNIATLGHFPWPKKFICTSCSLSVFLCYPVAKFHHKKTVQAGGLNIDQIQFAFNLPN
jgi:hypothetical protein